MTARPRPDPSPLREPPPETERPGGLPAILGAVLGFTSVVMAPVPFLGPVLALAGAILSWCGRASEFTGSARFGLWSNGLGLVVGIAATAWFLRRYG